MVSGNIERESISAVKFLNKYSQKYTALFSNMSSAWQHDLNINAGIIARGFHTVKNVTVFTVPARDVTNQTLPGRE
jgi:hypothetical protein